MRIYLFAATFILLLATVLPTRSAFVQLQAEGIVTNSTNLPALVGQQWALTLIYDTAAPDQVPGDPGYGNYLNTSAPPAMRRLDLTVGGYAIHLLDPMPTSANQGMVRFDIDNGGGTKSFFAHVDDAGLLPSWGNQQVNGFMLFLLDNANGGYADGTDALPIDPTLTLMNFTNSELHLDLGGGDFTGALTSLSFAIIPTLPPGSEKPILPPTVRVIGKKQLTTSKTKLLLKGTATNATLITVKVGKAAARPALGTNAWRFTAKLKPGSNKLLINATGPGGVSAPAKMTILRK